jgi:hypothetical protein
MGVVGFETFENALERCSKASKFLVFSINNSFGFGVVLREAKRRTRTRITCLERYGVKAFCEALFKLFQFVVSAAELE